MSWRECDYGTWEVAKLMTSDETRSLLDKEKIKSQSLCLREASPHSLNRFGERSTNQQFSPRKAKIFKESVSETEMLINYLFLGPKLIVFGALVIWICSRYVWTWWPTFWCSCQRGGSWWKWSSSESGALVKVRFSMIWDDSFQKNSWFNPPAYLLKQTQCHPY